MRDTLIVWSDRIIRYGIYALFFLVPLVFTNNTSELFELNKMWLTWEVTIFIAGAWFTKMILEGKFSVKRTPLDIPLLLFLLSQIISTIFSMDPHTSFWGYYSRFNGGLLSTITYIFLYYAVVTNLTREHVMTILKVTLASATIVAIWGLPSHFGKDPTCLLFQGNFDVSCWTDAFRPTARIFSTLGQPAWMAAYLDVVLPITITFFLLRFFPYQKEKHEKRPSQIDTKTIVLAATFFILVILFYVDLIFSNTRAGTLGFWIANVFFWGVLFYKQLMSRKDLVKYFVIFNVIFLALSFIFGSTFYQLDKFTLPGIIASQHQTAPPTQPAATVATQTTPAAPAGSFEGTDSGKIRQIVWNGAIDVWKAHPIFGSGVETFAFAYYQYRPAAHNLTSEWDYLYNKAHNEYLNYLATTGIMGLGTYLAFIIVFLFIITRYLLQNDDDNTTLLVVSALTAAFISILITNFFAFSVVIINLYLFLIPAFLFLFAPSIASEKVFTFPRVHSEKRAFDISALQWISIITISLIGLYSLVVLIRFWYADTAYALGSNLNRVQEYQQSYLKLGEAVNLRPSEPTFKDEFALNNATIAVLLLLGNDASTSAESRQQAQALMQQAIALSNEDVTKYPNNITFWKNRVRMFYILAQVDNQYLPAAVESVERVHQLAPTDAKVLYNLGALYRENKNPEKAATVLEETIRLKPDYRDAYFALALAYNDMAESGAGRVIHPELRDKAIQQLKYILEHISPDDKDAKQTLTSWNAL